MQTINLNKKNNFRLKPYESAQLALFIENIRNIATNFANTYPPGTFIKTWLKSQKDILNDFGYICTAPRVDLDDDPMSDDNIYEYESFKIHKNKYESCVSVCFVPISIIRDDYLPKRIKLCSERVIEKTSIDEFKKYMTDYITEQIRRNKEDIKTHKEFIKDWKVKLNGINKTIYSKEEKINKMLKENEFII